MVRRVYIAVGPWPGSRASHHPVAYFAKNTNNAALIAIQSTKICTIGLNVAPKRQPSRPHDAGNPQPPTPRESAVFDKPNIEIPAALCDWAEKNVEHIRTVYRPFLAMAEQTQDLMSSSDGSPNAAAQDVQSKALRYDEQNVDASFRFAADLAQARHLQDNAAIQTRFARTQVQTCAQ